MGIRLVPLDCHDWSVVAVEDLDLLRTNSQYINLDSPFLQPSPPAIEEIGRRIPGPDLESVYVSCVGATGSHRPCQVFVVSKSDNRESGQSYTTSPQISCMNPELLEAGSAPPR